MPGALEKLMALNTRIARLCMQLSAIGLIYCTVVIGWQIFSRYLLNDSPQWSETSVLFVMVWFIMIAAAAGVHEKMHIGISFTLDLMPKPMRKACSVLIHLVVGSFGGCMVYFGAQQVMTTWGHVIPTLGISTGLSYMPFPLAGLLFVLFSIEHLWRAARD